MIMMTMSLIMLVVVFIMVEGVIRHIVFMIMLPVTMPSPVIVMLHIRGTMKLMAGACS